MTYLHNTTSVRAKRAKAFIMRKQVILTVVGLVASWVTVVPSLAGYWKWTDEKGVVHIVSDVQFVPEEYSDQIRTLEPSLDKITKPSPSEVSASRATSSLWTPTQTSSYPEGGCEEPPRSREDGVCLIIKWWLRDNLDTTELRFLDVSPVGWLGDIWLQRVEFVSRDAFGDWDQNHWVFYLEGCGATAKVLKPVEW